MFASLNLNSVVSSIHINVALILSVAFVVDTTDVFVTVTRCRPDDVESVDGECLVFDLHFLPAVVVGFNSLCLIQMALL